jgi:PAS domain S-box-containing protein
MEIDIRTLIVILGISHLMQVVVFFHQFKVKKMYNGIGWWLMWSAAECIGLLFLLLRGFTSILPLVIIVQNTAIILGAIFIYIGVMRFFSKRENLKIIIFIFSFYILGLLYFLFINNDINIRSIILSISIAAISFLTAISLYKNKTSSINATANFNIVIFILHGIIFVYRACMILTGTPINDMFSPTLFNVLPFFDALIVSLLWTFGFIIMVNQRLNVEMKEAKEHFESIFNTNPDAAVISGINDGVILDINHSFEILTGFTRKESIGKSILDIHVWKNPDNRKILVNELQQKGFCNNFETIFQRKDGSEITGLMSAKIITLQGSPHIISVTRDITDLKKSNEEIRLKNEELQRINSEKDKFFSIIAHDLRSPFNVFLGFTEIMQTDLQSMSLEDIKVISKKMNSSANSLYGLLTNLLEWSMMQRGITKFNPKSILIAELVRNIINIYKEQITLKEIDIKIMIPDNLSVIADKYMIETVIRNLLSNALKYTPHVGRIIISAKSYGNNTVEVSIKDNGIGMDNDTVKNLFRIDKGTGRRGIDGEISTGLGLIICKGFIEKHNGKISVESEEGKGSRFYFTLRNVS